MRKRADEMTEQELLQVIADQLKRSRLHLATMKYIILIVFLLSGLGFIGGLFSALLALGL